MLKELPDSEDTLSEKLKMILKELYTVSGFRMSLYDANLNQLCAWPEELTPFCSLIQQNKKRCHSAIPLTSSHLKKCSRPAISVFTAATADFMKLLRHCITSVFSQAIS